MTREKILNGMLNDIFEAYYYAVEQNDAMNLFISTLRLIESDTISTLDVIEDAIDRLCDEIDATDSDELREDVCELSTDGTVYLEVLRSVREYISLIS